MANWSERTAARATRADASELDGLPEAMRATLAGMMEFASDPFRGSRERRVMPEELDKFSECFIAGSAAEVTAVSEIAHWRFAPGAITQQLMADYTAEVQPKGAKAAA